MMYLMLAMNKGPSRATLLMYFGLKREEYFRAEHSSKFKLGG